MTRSLRSRVLHTLLLTSLVAGLGAFPQLAPETLFPGRVATAQAQPATIPINRKRARIEDFVKGIAQANRRTILVPDDVRGTITIVSKRQATPEEAWAVMEASLSILGFSLLPSTAGTWRIAKVAEAIGESPFRAVAGTAGDAFVTTLIPLRSAKLQDILKVLEPLSGSRVTLVPYEATNSLIASGSERAIARLTSIADELDRVEEKTLRMRVLRYRGVGDVEPLVEGYLASGGHALSGIQVWSDERTNSLVVRGDDEGVARVIAFIEDVDRRIDTTGSIRIVRVLHRDPAEVAELIRDLSDSGRAATSEAQSAATPLDGADYSIAVDPPSRSLIIKSDAKTFRSIRDVLEILDVQPQLIAVDITISELRTPSNYGVLFGFQLPFATGDDTSDLFGFVRSSPTTGDAAAIPTVFGRVQRDTGVAFVTTQNGVPVVIPILQSGTIAGLDFKATNEVLIQPSLVVTVGEQHEIFSGNNVPVPVTDDAGISDNTTIGGVNIAALSRTTRFDRKDVGTRLGIEASTGSEGKIQLDLEVEISALDLTRVGLGGDPLQVGPSFVEQSLVVTARLDDGESAVLAVDRRKRETKIRGGVPFFRDLPFFGFLFSSSGTVVEDVRLMIAARARRVSNPTELVADTIRRRLAFERRNARENGLPDFDGPPYGVRVTTRRLEEDADAIAESLRLRGYESRVHDFRLSGTDYYDVYVTGLQSMVDAGTIAEELWNEGWQADLVVFSKRS